MLFILATTAFGVSGTWTDFANNLGSDLAPLIALFGEQVTIQYLSESFSILDNLVFALAPIGIITAVVAAIRVAGNAQLRSFIGRATESRGTVEADLMSSTSSDVCELWNGQGVVRVLGSPRLLQLIYFPSKKYDGEAGIYELPEAVGSNLYREDRLFHAWNLDAEGNHQPEAHLEHQNPPNLSLNININIKSRRRNAKILTFVGVLLQGGVLVFAGLVQYKPAILEDNQPIGYGFPLFLSGTLSLAVGMFLCAQVVESSTTEYTYKPTDILTGPVITMWVQMGGQMVGDQLFESFARKGGSATVLISHRSKKKLNFLAIIAVATTLFGFTTQFVGLRAMHATITVAQLGVVLLMTALRSFSHMQRIGDNDLKSLNHGDEEELNWVARSILGCGSWDVSRSFSPPLPPPSPHPPVTSVQPENTAMDLMITRARLATLTPKWPSRNRINAQNLQKALDNTINYVFGNMTLREDWGEELQWAVPVATTSRSHVSLRFKRKKDENGRWKPWSAAVNQLEAVICLWASSLREHLRTGTRLTYTRLLGPTTEHSEPDHKLWISRGTTYQTIPASEIDDTQCFGWWESVRNEDGQGRPGDTLHVTTVTPGDIEKHCIQDVYGWFVRGLMRSVADIGGTTTLRLTAVAQEPVETEIERWNWLSVQNSSLDQLAVYFVESDLGTLEEAYFCLVPALRNAKIMPDAKVINQKIVDHLLQLMEACQWSQALEVGRWYCCHALNADHLFRASTHMKGLLRDLAPTIFNSYCVQHSPQEWWNKISSEWEEIAAPSDDHLHGLLTLCKAHSYSSSGIFPANIFRRACEMAQTLNVNTPRIARLVLDLARFALENKFLDEAETLSSFVWKTAAYSRAMGWRMNGGWSDDISDQAAELVMDIYRVGGQSWVDKQISPEYLHGVTHQRIRWNSSISGPKIQSIPIALLVISKSRTALQWAAENGWGKLVLRLLDNGADVNAEAGMDHGRTALQAAAGGGHIDIVEALIAKGATINARASNRGGRTALQAAAGGGHETVVKMLLEAKVNVEVNAHAADVGGRTALQAAAEGGHETVVKMLLKADADIHVGACPDNGRTALQAAAGGGHQSIVTMLIELKADVNAEASDVGGRTTLQAAAEGGHYEILELLIAAGADINAKACSSGGRTAVQAAAGGGHLHLVSRLQRADADMK